MEIMIEYKKRQKHFLHHFIHNIAVDLSFDPSTAILPQLFELIQNQKICIISGSFSLICNSSSLFS